MRLVELGLIVLAIIVVGLRKTTVAEAEAYLVEQRKNRAENLQGGIPLDYEDMAARRAEGFD